MTRLRNLVLILPLLIGAAALAEDGGALDGHWQIGLSFGEIPILAGSFKPGVTVGYHVDERVFIGLDVQTPDHLQRDQQSFNARNTGLEGLATSSETTGVRALLSVRVRPNWRLPFVQVGVVYNGDDTETMVFDAHERPIGSGIYPGDLIIEQTRPSGFGLAVGLGYQYDFSNDLSAHLGIALALLSPVPDPEIQLGGAAEVAPADVSDLRAHLTEVYKENLHNHYHLFSVGVGYRFE
jgi:hypothetical protein